MITSGNRRFRARILHCLDRQKVEDLADGVLEIDAQGRVLSCLPYAKAAHGHLVELPGRLLIPGLVDCHSHIPQLDCRGRHGATLLDWLDRHIFSAERAFVNPAVVDDVAGRFFKKLILNGTTTSGLYATVHAAATDRCFEIAQAAGVRCFIGKVMMDRHAPEGLLESTRDSLRRSESLALKWHGAAGGRLRYAFTPRFAPTCSLELLTEAGKLANSSGAYLQSHIAETEAENARVRELFPQFQTYAELFESTGCLGPRTILAHAIHLSDAEFGRLAATRTRIAHCPTANFFLKSGRMRLGAAEQAGICVGLGTDVGAGTSLSLFTEMRHADFTQEASPVAPQHAFWLATMGGAEAFSMEGEIGNFLPGKHADFCVLEIAGIDPNCRLAALSTDEVLSLLMYRGDSRVIEATYVDGVRLDVDAIG